MEKYSINEAGKQLGLSNYTLRYYDRIGLVSPSRGNNSYRYYNESDISQLKYIEIMKYAGLSLDEIRAFVLDGHSVQGNIGDNCLEETIALITKKKAETIRKIASLNAIVTLFDTTVEVLKNFKPGNPEKAGLELNKIYEQIKGE